MHFSGFLLCVFCPRQHLGHFSAILAIVSVREESKKRGEENEFRFIQQQLVFLLLFSTFYSLQATRPSL